MRNLLIALLFLLFPGGASAGERSWAGFYVGAHGAYVSLDTDYANPATPSQNLDGAMVGIQAGYNWQLGRVVFGVEADASFGKVHDFIRDGNFLTEDGKLTSMGTVRARLGYSFGNFLPYVTGGFMWGRLEQGITCPAAAAFGICATTGQFDSRSTETITGWTGGFGGEYVIAKNWSLKGEMLFGKFDTEKYTGTVPVFGTQTSPVYVDLVYSARVGVNYKF